MRVAETLSGLQKMPRPDENGPKRNRNREVFRLPGSEASKLAHPWPHGMSQADPMLAPGQPIEDFMTPVAHTVDLETPLSAARKLMRTHDIRHLPIVDGSKLVGLLSAREVAVLEAFPFIDSSKASVADAMQDEPYAVAPSTPLTEVLQVMADRRLGSAVVVRDATVVGIFTTTDALQLLAQLANR